MVPLLAAVVALSVGPSDATFQVFTGPSFEALANRTDRQCPKVHVRFFKAGDLDWEEEAFEDHISRQEQKKVDVAIARSADGGPRMCKDKNGLSCSAYWNLTAIRRAGLLYRFSSFVCVTKLPE